MPSGPSKRDRVVARMIAAFWQYRVQDATVLEYHRYRPDIVVHLNVVNHGEATFKLAVLIVMDEVWKLVPASYRDGLWCCIIHRDLKSLFLNTLRFKYPPPSPPGMRNQILKYYRIGVLDLVGQFDDILGWVRVQMKNVIRVGCYAGAFSTEIENGVIPTGAAKPADTIWHDSGYDFLVEDHRRMRADRTQMSDVQRALNEAASTSRYAPASR